MISDCCGREGSAPLWEVLPLGRVVLGGITVRSQIWDKSANRDRAGVCPGEIGARGCAERLWGTVSSDSASTLLSVLKPPLV